LPVFLAPVVGVANVIPVMAVAMLFNNGSRVGAFWRDVQWTHVGRVLALGLPACAAGAYSYTRLAGDWIAVLLARSCLPAFRSGGCCAGRGSRRHPQSRSWPAAASASSTAA
jgi:hypothetical protein